MDEFFEAATLIQTRKIEDFPLVLMGVEYWQPLIDFVRTTMVREGTIDETDIDRILLTDDVAEAVAYIRKGAHQHLGKLKKPPPKPNVLLGERVPTSSKGPQA